MAKIVEYEIKTFFGAEGIFTVPHARRKTNTNCWLNQLLRNRKMLIHNCLWRIFVFRKNKFVKKLSTLMYCSRNTIVSYRTCKL